MIDGNHRTGKEYEERLDGLPKRFNVGQVTDALTATSD